jgi:hypothetical protein
MAPSQGEEWFRVPLLDMTFRYMPMLEVPV